jgi:serine/threonine protein kinase
VYVLKEANYLSDIKLNTALMTDKEIIGQIGRRSGTTVYAVKSTKSDHNYVLKHISVPESQKHVSALIFSGAASDEQAAQEYYQNVVSDYQEELELLETLSTSPNLSCFHSYEIKPKTEGVGFDVYLLAEDRTTLDQYLLPKAITQVNAVNLAMDLCSALNDLRNAGLIHRDVKPSNIFLNNQGHFMLGDMGIARIDQLKYCSMPESMLSPYSAPELFELMANVNETIDIYSIGLILYRIYNGNHAPFEDEQTSAASADKLRITGQEMPAPMFADYEIAEIIRKACAFKPEDRYQNPDEMKQALVDYMMRNQVGETPIIPPIVADEDPVAISYDEEVVEPVQSADPELISDDFRDNFSPDSNMLDELIKSIHKDIDNDYEDKAESSQRDSDMPFVKPSRRKGITTWLPTVALLLVLLAALGAAVWYFFIRVETLQINNILASDHATDSITIRVDTEEDAGSFEIICSDGYGSVQKKTFTGDAMVFDSLVSGVQYTFSVQGFDRENIAGVPSIYASTISTTNVISLAAGSVTVTSAELTFVIDGQEPNEWHIAYGPTGQDPSIKVFQGHSVMLNNLTPDTEYTVTLQDLSDTHLSGNTSITFRTLPSVSISGEVIVNLSDGVGTISWQYSGQAPESWTVTCVGTKGYEQTLTVHDSTCTLENLVGGETYTVTISCDNMLNAASLHFTPNGLVIKELTATPGENGTAEIKWICEASDPATQWLVVYAPANSKDMETAIQTDTTAITLSGLIPSVSYDIEIRTVAGDQVDGGKSMLLMPDAGVFGSYGFTSAYVSIWLRPSAEEWTATNLKTIRTSFSTTEKIAFACQSLATPKDSSDKVTTLIVVRDSSGTLVDYYAGEEVWSNMWSKHGGSYLYVGELLRTPQTPGDYTFEIYFNGQLVNSGAPLKFTIKAKAN